MNQCSLGSTLVVGGCNIISRGTFNSLVWSTQGNNMHISALAVMSKTSVFTAERKSA